MQIALIIAAPQAFEDMPDRDGMALVAGRSILHHQLELALAAGCERVICLADRPPPDFEHLRQACMRAGAHLRLLHRPRELSAMVASSDRLLVIGKQVLIESKVLPPRNEALFLVLALPADPAVSLGFERIDATRAWAGLMLLPGHLVEGLHQLPGDIDPASALLRIALMASTPVRELPINALTRQEISLPRDPAAVRGIESGRISRLADPVGYAAPARAVVERLAMRAAPRLLATPFGTSGMTGITGALLLLAVLAGQAGFTGLALAVSALVFAGVTGLRIVRRVAGGAGRTSDSQRLDRAFVAAADVALIYILANGDSAGAVSFTAWFAPLMLLGLLWLASSRLPVRLALPAGDRVLLAGLLALANLGGFLTAAVMILSLIILAVLFTYETGATDITTD